MLLDVGAQGEVEKGPQPFSELSLCSEKWSHSDVATCLLLSNDMSSHTRPVAPQPYCLIGSESATRCGQAEGDLLRDVTQGSSVMRS